MLYKAKKYLSLVCKLHCSRFCSFVQCINMQTNFNQLEQFLQAEYLRKYSSSRKLPDSLEGSMSLKLLSIRLLLWLLFDKHPMKAQLRRNKGTTRALCMHDHWNSGSKHVHQLLMPDYCTNMMHNDKIWPILLELWWPTPHT